jgi:hypothetical protein
MMSGIGTAAAAIESPIAAITTDGRIVSPEAATGKPPS